MSVIDQNPRAVAGDNVQSIDFAQEEITRLQQDYGHIGKELGVIIRGQGECEIGKRVYRLKKGDSISFSADVPHQLRNIRFVIYDKNSWGRRVMGNKAFSTLSTKLKTGRIVELACGAKHRHHGFLWVQHRFKSSLPRASGFL